MKALLLLPALPLLAACSVSLPAPNGAAMTCAKNSDCPTPLLCQTTNARCVAAIDSTPPSLSAANAIATNAVVLHFDEAMGDNAAAAAAATSITPSLAIVGASWDATDEALSLQTEVQTVGTTYTVTVAAIADRAGNVAQRLSASFVGFGLAPDTTPPTLVSPEAHALLSTLDGNVTLSWIAVTGANTYSIEIATDTAFTAPIAGSPFSVSAPQTQLQLPPLAADATYFWRVAADVSSGPSSAADFDVNADIFYVRCLDTETCDDSDTPVQTGSKVRPLRDLNRALALAALFYERHTGDIPSVQVATRPLGLAYETAVGISQTAVALRGGYNDDFSAEDVDGNRTIVSNPGRVLSIASLSAATLITGFHFVAEAAPTILAAQLQNCGDMLDMGHFDITLEAADSNVNALTITSGAATSPHIHDFSVTAASSPNAVVVLIDMSGASAAFDHCTLTGGDGFSTEALSVNGPNPAPTTVDSCTMSLGTLSSSQDVGTIFLQGDQTFSLSKSTVLAPTGGGSSYALFATGAVTQLQFIEDTLIGGTFTIRAMAIELEGATNGGSTVLVASSVLVGGATAASVPETLVSALYASATDVTISDSVLVSGSSAAGPSAGGALATSAPSRLNATNTIFGTLDACDNAIYNGGDLDSLQDNAFFGCTNDYSSSLAPSLTTSTAINALDGAAITSPSCGGASQPLCPTSRVGGNTVLDESSIVTASDVFADPSSNDYQLNANPPAVLGDGGIDTTQASCGPHEAAVSCGGMGFNRDGDAKSAPYTIGAY